MYNNTTIKCLLSEKQLDSKNTKYRTPAFCLNIGNTCYNPRILNVYLHPSSKFLPFCETPDFEHLSGILEVKYTDSANCTTGAAK